jgi:hypothetical protein
LRHRGGRLKLSAETVALSSKCRGKTIWGAEHFPGELVKLGIAIAMTILTKFGKDSIVNIGGLLTKPSKFNNGFSNDEEYDRF